MYLKRRIHIIYEKKAAIFNLKTHMNKLANGS